MSTVCYCGHPTCPATEHKPERCATACCDCLRADVERLNRENARLAAGHTIEGDGVSDADLLRAEVERLKAALRECVAFVEDDTCRHDYEKRAPLKRAREALGEDK